MARFSAFLAALVTIFSAAAGAGTTNVAFEAPDLDRWMYPFNASPGFRTSAPSFGAIGVDGFDDRDAQFLLGFDTGVGMDPAVEPGLGTARYDVLSAQVTITVTTAGGVAYDPTQDAVATYFDETDPDFQPDSDAGRPIEIYGVGYRNGFTAETFLEDSSFGPTLVEGARNAYPTDFEGGMDRDVSNNVRDRFGVKPFAVGQAPALTPGDAIGPDTVFVFDLDVSDPDVQSYLRENIDNGRIRLLVTSLHFASGGADGGDGVTYPIFYTKENKFAIPFGLAATLDLSVEILDALAGDLNGDGAVNAMDLGALLGFWGTTAPEADLDGNGTIGAGDLSILLGNWTG